MAARAPGAELVWLLEDLRSQSAALASDVKPVASLAFVVGQSVLVSIAFLRSAAAALIQFKFYPRARVRAVT